VAFEPRRVVLPCASYCAAFTAVDRVIQTGQDPRRFVEDLLERLRDLIVVAATRDGAAAVLRGIPQDELDRMSVQATAFGAAELSRAADVVNSSLTEMTGATSPRLHLELMVARLLVPAADDTDRGTVQIQSYYSIAEAIRRAHADFDESSVDLPADDRRCGLRSRAGNAGRSH